MKKFWLSAITFFAVSAVVAQTADNVKEPVNEPVLEKLTETTKGNLYVAAFFDFNTSSTKGNVANNTGGFDYETTATATHFGITPKVGMMITDQLGIHLIVGGAIGATDTPVNAGGKTKTKLFKAGLGAKYFLGKGKVFFSPSLDLSFANGCTKTEIADPLSGDFDYEVTGSLSRYRVGITPAVTYFINSKWSTEIALQNMFSYSSTVLKNKDKSKASTTSSFDKPAISGLSVGITYWLK